MATKPSVKLYLALGGQQEFRTRLQACQKEVKTFQSELKALADRYDGNANHIDALTAKQKILEQEYEALQRKQKTANDALADSAQDYDKCSKNLENLKEKLQLVTDQHDRFKKSVAAIEEYEKLTKAIDDQEGELIDLNKALKNAKEQQEKLRAEGKEGTEEYEKQTRAVDKLEDAVEELSKELETSKGKQKDLYEANKDAFKAYEDQEKQISQLEKAIEKEGSQVAECERRMATWRGEIANTERQLDSVEGELKQNKQYIEEAKNSYDHCATSIDKFGNTAESQGDELQALRNGVKGVNDELNGMDLDSFSRGIVNYQVALSALVDILRQVPRLMKEAFDYVVDVGASFEAQMSKVGAISGTTGTEMESLSELAKEMGRTTKFSATEAGEAYSYMAMAGWDAQEMMDGLPGIMNLAAASGESLATTSDIVTDALTAFGLSAKDSTHFADLLATASANANTNVSMMGETFKYVAPVAGAMGYSAEDVAEAIGLMANSGIKASSAGTALRSIITRLGTDAGASSTKLGALGILTEKLGVQFYDSRGNARAFGDVIRETREAWKGLDDQQAVAYANQIAGKNALSGWMALMEASEEDIDKLSGAIANCDGAAQGMAQTMNDNLSGAITIFNSALEGFGIAVYDKISDPLTKVVELGIGVVSAITGWLDPAKSEIEEYISEISKGNEQIKKNLEEIQTTLNQELSDAGQMESYRQLFHDVLEDGQSLSGLTITDAINGMVSDIGHLSEDGLTVMDAGFWQAIQDVGNLKETDILGGALESSTSEITTDITGVGDATEDSGKDFDKFGDLVVEVLTDVDGAAETTKGNVGDVGEAAQTAGDDVKTLGSDVVEVFETVDTTTENSKEKIKAFFAPVAKEQTFWVTIDNVTGKMGVLTEKEKEAAEAKGELLGKTSFQADQSFIETLEQIGSGLENVVLVTDDFQKRQITRAIEHIAQLKPEARDLWNEQYGILSNNVEILDTLIDMEEAYLVSQAFTKARAAIYEELGNAYVELYKAESAAKNVLDETNKQLSEAGYGIYDNIEDAIDAVTRLEGVVDQVTVSNLIDANQELGKSNENINGLNEELEECNNGLALATERFREEGIELETVNEVFEGNATAVSTATGNINDFADEVDEATEVTDEAAESADELAESVDELNKELQRATEEGLKDQKKALQELQDEYKKLREEAEKTIQDIVHGDLWNYGELGEGEEPPSLTAMRDALAHNMAEMDQWKADMETLSGQIGSTISLGFFESILDKGPEYGAEVRAMINDLFTTGGTNLHALSTTYDDVTNRETNMSKYFGALKFTMDNSLAEVAEGLDYDGFWNIVREYLYNAEYENPIDNQMVLKLGELSGLANRIGAGLPEELAEGIIEGSISPGEAVNSVNEIILARLEGLVDQANEMGAHIPPSLLEGVEAGRISVEGAFNEVLDSIADITGIEVQGHAAGNHFLQSFTEGMDPDNANTIEYYNEAGEVYDRFTEGIKDNIDATEIGEKVIEDTAKGIEENKGNATDQAEDVVSEAETKATAKAQDFKATGETAVQSMTDGAKSKQKTFADQMNDIVKAGLDKVDEYDDDFQKAGKDIPDQIAKGVEGNVVSDAVDAAVKAAVEAAGSHGDAFEAKGGSFISAMINGVANPNYQQQLAQALSNAVIYAQNSIDTSMFSNIGLQIDNGIAQGITNNQSIVTTAASNAAVAAYNAATSALQIQSPSRLFETGVGQMIAKGMAKGIEDGELYLIDAIDQTVQAATSEAEELVLRLNDELEPLVLKVDMDTSSLDQLAPPEIEGSATLAGLADQAEVSAYALASYAESTDLGSLIAENTKSLERLIDCATLMLNAAKTMGEKVGVTIINEIDGQQFDSRIRTVSQKSINQRSRQLAYAGGR